VRELTVATADDMRELGRWLADRAGAGDLIVLTGDLGAGKTTLVQGIAAGLGVSAPVLSPTFVIARVHNDGRVPLVHVDAYRLGSTVEVDDLDLDASVADSVTVVEWGAGLVETLTTERLDVRIMRSADETDESRRVQLMAVGDRWLSTLSLDVPLPGGSG
jgi:tRNA threonylcarbamoyladenosine biosynthesis protein TsaE